MATFKSPYEEQVKGYKDTITSETARYSAAGNNFLNTSRYGNLNKNIKYYSEGGTGYNEAFKDFQLNEAKTTAPSLGLTPAQLMTNPELAKDPVALAKYTGGTAGGVNYAPGTPAWQANQDQSQNFGKITPTPLAQDPTTLRANANGLAPTPNGLGGATGFAPPPQPVSQGTPEEAQMLANFQGGKMTADQYNQWAAKFVADKYKKGFEEVKQSGTPAPSDGGTAREVVQGTTTPSTTPTASSNPVLDNLFQEDKNIANFSKQIQDFLSPKTQQTTLRQEYESLAKAKGLEGMNTELMNMKNVIEGTEDDIRAEITKSGGFATDSQVMALTNARNKTLIKNYNNLLQTKQQAEDYVKTMMGLEEKDRTAASDKLDSQLDLSFKLMDYQEKMQTNARNTLQKVVDQVGYAGVQQMTQGNPYYASLVENTLGLGAGGLAKLSTFVSPEAQKAQLEIQKLEQELEYAPTKQAQDAIKAKLDELKVKADIANTYSQIKERDTPQLGTPTITGKPQTTVQASANGYADRLNEANIVIDQLGSKFTSALSLGGSMPNFLQSSDRQAYEQAKRNFVNAVLRRESGAAISASEFDSAEKQYFPQAGDKPEVVKQKEVSRNTAINNIYREANVVRPVKPGQIIESGGKRYVVGSDGQTLTQI